MKLEVKERVSDSGVVIIATLMFLILFTALLGAYFAVTNGELKTIQFLNKSTKGFHVAEGAANLRAAQVKNAFGLFQGQVPMGTSPILVGPNAPCEPGNEGTLDFACQTHEFARRDATSYVVLDPDNPRETRIAPGEAFQGLNALANVYTVYSNSRRIGTEEREARVQLEVESVSVPMFQFAVFFEDDLEFYPGPEMTVTGPVHTNGSLYVSAGNSLTFTRQVTSVGEIYRGEIWADDCRQEGDIFFPDISFAPLEAPDCNAPRYPLTDADLAAYGGNVLKNVDRVEVPAVTNFDPRGEFWQVADLRIMLRLQEVGGAVARPAIDATAPTGVEVVDVDNVRIDPLTDILNNRCDGLLTSRYKIDDDPNQFNNPNGDFDFNAGTVEGKAVAAMRTFYNRRENDGGDRTATLTTLLDIDVQSLLNCIHDSYTLHGSNLLGTSELDDDSEDGLVIYVGVNGPDAAEQKSFYGVRFKNGKVLQSTRAGAARVKGLTFVTQQGVYVEGDYNAPDPIAERIPAAIIGDTFNVLSNEWCDVPNPANLTAGRTWYNPGSWNSPNVCDRKSARALGQREVSDTAVMSVYAAVLSGSDNYLVHGRETGGVHNFIRFHEDWSEGSATLTYRGSLVSLGRPRHNDGAFECCDDVYGPPLRDWGFETMFSNRNMLPPATPSFTYVKQQMFDRLFE